MTREERINGIIDRLVKLGIVVIKDEQSQPDEKQLTAPLAPAELDEV
jgi:hypothetical protein